MSEHSYRILVTTSNNYLPILRVSSWLVNKYWSPLPTVLVAGFNPPEFDLPSNYSFLSLGDQKDYPFNLWSNALIKLLHTIDDEVYILFLDDYLPVRYVDTRNIGILVDYAYQFGYILKIDICCDRLYAFGADTNFDYVAHIDLIKSQPGSPYHSSLYPGIWRKDNMLRTLIKNESPHDYELIGTTRVSHIQDLVVLGTRNYPLKIALGLRGGESGKLNLSELQPQDAEELHDLGYLKPWDK